MNQPTPNAEPGTGTQYAIVAKPPKNDRDLPCLAVIGGHGWGVGRDYIDLDVMDVCTLKRVVCKSPWCDTGPAKDGTVQLDFEYERYDSGKCQPVKCQETADRLAERFQLRHTTRASYPSAPEPWRECDDPFEREFSNTPDGG